MRTLADSPVMFSAIGSEARLELSGTHVRQITLMRLELDVQQIFSRRSASDFGIRSPAWSLVSGTWSWLSCGLHAGHLTLLGLAGEWFSLGAAIIILGGYNESIPRESLISSSRQRVTGE